MKLRSLHITAFKSVLDATIDFDPKITILIGGNDSGKSNILLAIANLATPPVKELTCQFSPQYGRGEAFTIESTFSDVTEEERPKAPHYTQLQDGRDIGTVRLQLKLGGSYEAYYGTQKISGSPIPDWSTWLPSVQNIHCGQVALLEDSVSLNEFQTNPSKHPAFYNLLKLGGISESYSFIGLSRIDLLRMLDMVNRNVSGLVKSIWRQDSTIMLDLRKDGDNVDVVFRETLDTMVPIGARGDGFQRLIALWVQVEALRLETKAGNSILLLDELDNYLHEQAQKDLMRLLEAWTDHFQIVYVTHSPFVIDANHLERVRLIEKTDKGTQVRQRYHFDNPEPLQSTIGSFVSAPLLMGERNVFVEGPSDQILLAGMALLLSELGRYSVDLNATKFISSGGDELTILRSATAKAERRAYTIALDGDARDKEAIRRAQRFYGVQSTKIVYFGEREQTIEDTFPVEDYVAAANSYYQSLGIPFTVINTETVRSWRGVKEQVVSQEVQFDKVGIAKELVSLVSKKVHADITGNEPFLQA